MMKKFLVLAMLVCGIGNFTSAQEIGIRFNNFNGSNVAIDGIFSLGKFSRLHTDVSFGSGVGLDVIWDFWHQQLGAEKGFAWYAGVGPSAFFGNDFNFGASGEVGIEYHFSGAPIALGVDWRPYFQMINTTQFTADIFGLNVRYCF